MRSTVALTVIALLAVTFAALLESGCPPDTDGASKVLLKALSGGCAGCAPRARQEKVILLPGGVPLVLVWIPPGTFQMGRYPGETGSSSKEDPKHQVTVPGFWMGKYEVTQRQWLALYPGWPGAQPNANTGLGDDHPAYYIAWYDAKLYTALLNDHIAATGQGPLTVRLPSEAEWEYACRAGTDTRFYFGDSPGCAADCSDCEAGALPGNRSTFMWYCGNNSPAAGKPVGLKPANDFGLYDMSGNVREWCEDDYRITFEGAPADGGAWRDAPRASKRVVRGGSAGSSAEACRSAFRSHPSVPHARAYYIGFRVAANP